MKRDNFTLPLAFPGELIIDNFAGGGGTSTGLEAAFGRPVDIAINHDPEALAMHAMNHPHTHHLCESVWDVDPIEVTGNQPVGLVWLSPDCKHFSKAKGATPVEKSIRGLAWVGMRWIAKTKPRVLMLENVAEFQTWGPLLVDEEGQVRPDPTKKGKFFESFLKQLRAHGYKVEYRELRACDNGAPTIRKRLFLVARRDGIPICWPDQSHGAPTSAAVIAGKMLPWRTAAECIDFTLPSNSIFGRKKNLAVNTQRRVAKGLWRHVLSSAKPFIIPQGGPVLAPFIGEHANASNQRNMAANEPLRTVCAQVKGGHFSVVAPTLLPLRGTSESHLNNGHAVEQPLSTISAGGLHHALVAGHITKFNTGSVGFGLDEPMATITAGGTPKRASTGNTQGLVGASMVAVHIQRDMGKSIGHAIGEPLATTTAGGGGKSALISSHLVTVGYGERPGQDTRTQDIAAPLGTVVAGGVKQTVVAAHLVDMGHGESTAAGAKRWSHGVRDIETPLNTITASGGTAAIAAVHLTHLTHHGERAGLTPDAPLPTITAAHRGEQAMVTAFMEQANGGFYAGDGRPVDVPVSTITAAGSNQQLVTAYLVKYYGNERDGVRLSEPMHTLPTKDRMGFVQVMQVSANCLSPEHRARARQCAALLHEHLPEQFPELADMVLTFLDGTWWALVDITLRMLKPSELFQAQSFPRDYVIHEIPNPALLFVNGKQVGNPLTVPRIPLTGTAQVRMCGNSVAPAQAEALARANFLHEALIYGRKAA
jgi:DNA (cytosine-5)-methyltransferase 1